MTFNWFAGTPTEKEKAEAMRKIGLRLNLIDESVAESFKKVKSDVDELNKRLDALSAKMSLLGNSGSLKEVTALQGELDALKLWKADIMRLLTQESTAGRPKLSTAGRWLKKKF